MLVTAIYLQPALQRVWPRQSTLRIHAILSRFPGNTGRSHIIPHHARLSPSRNNSPTRFSTHHLRKRFDYTIPPYPPRLSSHLFHRDLDPILGRFLERKLTTTFYNTLVGLVGADRTVPRRCPFLQMGWIVYVCYHWRSDRPPTLGTFRRFKSIDEVALSPFCGSSTVFDRSPGNGVHVDLSDPFLGTLSIGGWGWVYEFRISTYIERAWNA